MSAHSDDPGFLARLMRHDQAAWDELSIRERPRIYRLARGYVGLAEAEDVTQEVFLVACQKIHEFRGDAKLSTWLYRIAINKCLEFLRKRAGEVDASTLFAHDVPPAPAFDSIIFDRESIALLRIALQRLEPEALEVIALRYFEGLSYEAVGDEMGFCKSTISKKLRHAEEQLIKLLSRLRWRLQ